jgi:aarF domain-containing kinase
MASGTAVYSTMYFHDHFGGTEGLYRALSFYSLAIPKYVVYRYHQWIQSPDHVWDELDKETSQLGLDKILELRGFYIKCGQMCASNIGDAFPVVWQDTMSVLQDQVPPEDFETVILPILRSELDYDRIFDSVDPIPIGSASIGQVHRATLRDTLQPVVVKICYPHVERLLRGDVRTITAFCEVAQPVHVPSLKEVEKQFATEFDYRAEAENLRLVRDNLTRAGLCGPGRLCVMPEPYRELCTKRVLVMEELAGEKLVDVLKRDARVWAKHASKWLSNQDSERQVTREQLETYLAGLETSRRVQNALRSVYNWSYGLWFGTQLEYQSKVELPHNPAKLVDDLLLIHGHQVLVDGRFNADCHPGNFLLCRNKDGSHQLGLIDYGQVKTLTKEERRLLARIIVALDDDDKDEVVKLMKEAGFKSQRMDPDVIYMYAKVSYDQDSKELTNGKHIQMFMEDLQSRDPIIQLPGNYIMVGRTSILLRGLAHTLKQSRSVAKSWRPLAEQVLNEDIWRLSGLFSTGSSVRKVYRYKSICL